MRRARTQPPTRRVYAVEIAFGSSPEALQQTGTVYRFPTCEARTAFLNGVEAMDGWLGYEILRPPYEEVVPNTGRTPPPRCISLDPLRRILRRETACLAPEDVDRLMQVIRAAART